MVPSRNPKPPRLSSTLLADPAAARREIERNDAAHNGTMQRLFGIALFAVQTGLTPPIAKVLRGFGGAGVLELIEDDRSGTYRAVYAVRYATAVYVLHVFHKKSKHGIATPHGDIDVVHGRLKTAEQVHWIKAKEAMP